MYILGVIIIILLIRMIMNQHTIDEHIQESSITVLYKNTIYYVFKRGSK